MSERETDPSEQAGHKPASQPVQPLRVFINYRREDTAGHAGRLYDSLMDHFRPDQVFMDIDTIEPGVDFTEVIGEAVGACDVLIAVIGKEWLSVQDPRGRPRLENPEDYVRLEIHAALERKVRVIPVLVRGAAMPGSDEIPGSLGILARRNALELSDARWHYDVGRLIRALEKVQKEKAAESTGEAGAGAILPVEARSSPPEAPPAPSEAPRRDVAAPSTEPTNRVPAVTVPLPPPTMSREPAPLAPPPPPPTPSGAPPSRPPRPPTPLLLGGAAGVIALVVGLIVFLGGGDSTPETPPTSPGQETTQPTETSPSASVSPTTTEPSPTAPPVLGTVIFSDDFGAASDVFCQQSDSQARYSFEDGTYRIFVGRKNWSAWCRADSPALESLSNVAVEVDAGKDSGVTDGNFGVICGHVDNENFYELTMDSSDGFYRIAEWDGGTQEILTEGFSEQITTGNSSYRVRAECTGGGGGGPVTLALVVDGQQIAETTDDQNPFSSGSVGLIAGTFTEPDIETRFDNFTVLQLP